MKNNNNNNKDMSGSFSDKIRKSLFFSWKNVILVNLVKKSVAQREKNEKKKNKM